MARIRMCDVAEQIRGVSYKPEDVLDGPREDAVGIFRANNISDGIINFNDLVFVKRDKVLQKQMLRKGDILICASSGSKHLVGKAAQIEADCEYSFGAFCKVVRPQKINELFLGMYFQSDFYRRYISDISQGANINNIKNEHIDAIKLQRYSETEQVEIAKLLQKIITIIRLHKEQLIMLDELIKSRFVEMFGDPVYNPMEWPIKKLGDLSLQINSGNTPKGGEQVYVDEGITFFRSQNVWKDRLEMDDIAYIDEITHASMNRSSLKHGDILMTKTGRINTENSSLGRAALYMGEDDAANVNGHVYFIRLRAGVNNKFILRILVSDEYRDYIRSVCVGGIDKRQLNKDHIENFPIICPPESMTEEYIMFVEQIDKLKLTIQKSLKELETLKKSRMQEYFG